MLNRRLLLLAVALPATLTAHTRLAGAQSSAQAAPARLRATITAVHSGRIDVAERNGEKATLVLAPGATITAVVPAKLEDIKPGTFVGTTARTQADGTTKALEVHIFPEAMRGTGEGYRPWDLEPGSTMTNATVSSVSGVQGRTLLLTYKGGEQRVLVPVGTPIVTFAPGGMELLKPHASVIAFNASRQPDGTYSVSRISVGKDGLVVPM
jgi:hypothetical protein